MKWEFCATVRSVRTTALVRSVARFPFIAVLSSIRCVIHHIRCSNIHIRRSSGQARVQKMWIVRFRSFLRCAVNCYWCCCCCCCKNAVDMANYGDIVYAYSGEREKLLNRIWVAHNIELAPIYPERIPGELTSARLPIRIPLRIYHSRAVFYSVALSVIFCVWWLCVIVVAVHVSFS